MLVSLGVAAGSSTPVVADIDNESRENSCLHLGIGPAP
jgi:hypothetical protein